MKDKSGQTLVELIVALAMVVIIMSAVFAVFAFQDRAVKAANEGRNVFAQGRLILDRLSRDLNGVWLPMTQTNSQNITYKFEAKDNGLYLTTTASLSPDETSGSEIVLVKYLLADNREDAADRTRKLLIRYQKDNPFMDEDRGWSEVVLSRDVKSLEILYLRKGSTDELKDWTPVATISGLPAVIRIKLVLTTIPGQEETFVTRVSPPLTWEQVKKISMPPGVIR